MFVLFCVQFVWLLSGFSAVKTQASNIRCYEQTTVDGHPWPGFINGEVDCTDEYDRCGTLSFYLDSANIVMKNCSRSSDCNVKRGCDHAREVAQTDEIGPVSGCVETCCDSNLCNAQGKEERVRM